ncbi:MAG: ABC transporter permease [Bacteroidales bacterium]|nr:ABC transporter permease [Bacteroidales bacterium]
MKKSNSILRVFQRECRRVINQPRYLVILTLGAVLTFIIFATMTGEGQPQRLPVGVVDLDGSYLSRRICHELDATSGVQVHAVYNSHIEARRAMQRGELFAFYEIPKGTYNEVLQFKAPRMVLYTNQAYLLAGTLSYKQLATMGMLATGAVQREVLRKKGFTEDQIMGLIQPVAFETHNISNPWINYGIYLMTTLIPAVFAFIALMHTGYAISTERRQKSIKRWMQKARGNSLYAVLGKMLPYTLWYSLLALIANLVMFGFMGFPMEGSWLLMVLSTILLIFSAQCAGAFISCCLNDPSLAMSVCTLYSAMSFSLSGFSYPIESMPLFFQAFCLLYPIRHYFLNYREVAIYGNGFDQCWPQFCAFLAFGILLLLGAWMLHWQTRKNTAQ